MVDFEKIKLGILGAGLAGMLGCYVVGGVQHMMEPSLDEAVVMEEYSDCDGELPEYIMTVDGPLETASIDFTEDFEIETDRYRLVKDEDLGISRVLGWFGSLGVKMLFLDYDMGKGLDEEHAKRVLEMLEENEDISGITVRINHTGALEDFGRLFTDDDVKERNPFLARLFLGVPTSILEEMWAELARGDYYNPLTQTVVVYSNVSSVAAHEIGHHQDYQRHKSDWWYALLGSSFAPTRLYQEGAASFKYADKLLAPDEQYEMVRYLVPAFITYGMGFSIGAVNWVKKRVEE